MALVERSVVEQRYEAVVQVVDGGVPVTEVAARFGVSRQSVHAWVRRYREGGLEGLADRSHRPRGCPHQTPEQVEALVCELRGRHPRWGPQRMVYELERRGVSPLPSRAAVYRVLVRHGLVQPKARKRDRSDYVRWERSEPMALWQLDIMGGLWLPDGREAKLITGVDDHSRFCVIACVVEQATAKAVCNAFAAAMRRYGIPDEVLTDNGRQFTGRFNKPRPNEVLFERICRENGVTQRLTGVRSPTTTGKVERFHQTVRGDVLADHPWFHSVFAAQDAVDAWVDEYNQRRPHQSLGMACPAERFDPNQAPSDNGHRPMSDTGEEGLQLPAEVVPSGLLPALEVHTVVPACGNLWVAGRQLWLGTDRAGKLATIWLDATSIHLSVDGQFVKTLPSRFTAADLPRLRRTGAIPAGPPPTVAVAADPATRPVTVEVDRIVNACGLIALAGRQVGVGMRLAGHTVTVRVDDRLAHILTEGRLVKTIASPVHGDARLRLRGARNPNGALPAPDERLAVQRTVSKQGQIQVAGQRVQVGLTYRRKVVTVLVDDQRFQLMLDGVALKTVPRTTTKEVTRYRAWTRIPRQPV